MINTFNYIIFLLIIIENAFSVFPLPSQIAQFPTRHTRYGKVNGVELKPFGSIENPEEKT